MKRIDAFFLVVLLVSIAVNSPAEAQPLKELTLQRAITIALAQNPNIRAALKRYEAAVARTKQAKAFPEPAVYWDSDLQPNFFGFSGSAESYVGISQLIEFPGRRHYRGKVAEKEAEVAYSDTDIARLELILQVKIAFHEVLLAQEREKYARENLTLAEDFLQKAQIRYQAGSVARFEVLRAEVEVARAENQLRIASNEVDLTKAKLNFLLARRIDEPLELEGELERAPYTPQLQQLLKEAEQKRPELQGMSYAIKAQQYAGSLAKLSYLPDLDLQLNRHYLQDEGTFWDVVLSFSLPIFFWQRQQGEIAEARARAASLEAKSAYLNNQIALEVKDAYLRVLATQDRITLYKEKILKEAEEIYRIAIRSYQEGEIGYLEVLEARRTLMGIRLSYADVLLENQVAVAELEKATAADL